MAVDFGAFAKGFLDRSQQIMDENSEEAKEFRKRQRELADRNVGVIGKRRSTATAVLSAARGLSNLGVPKSVIRLAISTPGGLAQLKKKIDTARTEMGAEWNADLISSYVALPDEFQDNELLQQDGVSLKDFVYNTYGLSTPSLGPTSDELDAEPSGKFSMFDDFFNKNAMEKARTELGNEMIYGDMSVSEINKLAKQDEYSSQIEGAYVDYKNPTLITPTVQKNFLDDLNDIKQEWRRQNASQLTKLEDRRETLDELIRTSTNTSEANAALEVKRQAYISKRNRLLSSLSQNMNSTIDPFTTRYGPDNINELLTSRIEQYLSIDTPLDLSMRGTGTDGPGLSDTANIPVSVYEKAENLDDVNSTLNTATIKMLPGSTSGNYVIRQVYADGRLGHNYTTEVITNPQTGLLKIVTRDENKAIVPTLSFEDTDNNPKARAYLEKNPDLDFRVTLKDTEEKFNNFKNLKTKKPIGEVVDVSTEALNAAQTFFKSLNLTSSIDKSELNTATRKYYNNLTGELDKEKIKREVLKWAKNYNKTAKDENYIKVTSFAFGRNQLDELTDNVFNLLTKTESSDAKTSSGVTVVTDNNMSIGNKLSNEERQVLAKLPPKDQNKITVRNAGDLSNLKEAIKTYNKNGTWQYVPNIPEIDVSTQRQSSVLKEDDERPEFKEAPKVGLMSKPEVDFKTPESPTEPAPPRSEFMKEYGDDIMEMLLNRKNITLKNVEAGRMSQLNNALDSWKRKNKGVKISAKIKKEIIAEYIRSKGR